MERSILYEDAKPGAIEAVFFRKDSCQIIKYIDVAFRQKRMPKVRTLAVYR